jgi:tetratricopeptide (TPR) repeat protein
MSPGEAELLVLKCNKVAMDYLRLEKYREALKLLNKALDQLNATDKELQNWPNRLRLLGVTLNNFGCLYKRKGQPNVALYYLQKALKIELTTSNDPTNLSGTHLNLCAILSKLNRHEAALQHSQRALEVLKALHDIETGSDAEAVVREDSNGGANLVTTLIIAYHNVGTELEHLNRIDEAVLMYERAEDLSRTELNPAHPLSVNIRSNYEKAKSRSEHLTVLLSERQVLRRRARLNTQDRPRSNDERQTPTVFKGYEALQTLPSIKKEMGKPTSVSPRRRIKTSGMRFRKLNYSMQSPRDRVKTAVVPMNLRRM